MVQPSDFLKQVFFLTHREACLSEDGKGVSNRTKSATEQGDFSMVAKEKFCQKTRPKSERRRGWVDKPTLRMRLTLQFPNLIFG
jgi:hypothetical protein